MQISSFSPRAELAQFVRSFTLIETRYEATRTLLPDTGMVLGIRYGGFARQLDHDRTCCLPDASLAGMRASGVNDGATEPDLAIWPRFRRYCRLSRNAPMSQPLCSPSKMTPS